MGNIYAKSPVSPPSIIEPVALEKSSTQDVPPEVPGSSQSQNPGAMEDLHKKCKDVFPSIFEGSRFMVNKALSNHFQISHTINMSSLMPSGYRFGATYVGTNQFGPMEAYPVLLGDIDPNGNVNANIIHQFTKQIRAKFVAQIQDSKYVATQISADYKGLDFTATVTGGNIDLFGGSGITLLQYLQNVTQSVALGAELAYQFGPQVPGGEIAMFSLSGRYTAPQFTVSGTLGQAGAQVCYYRKENDNVQVGVEVQTNLRLAESVCSLGYQIDLPKANMVFRGMVDTNWTVGAVLEKRLVPLPFTFTLSGMINHPKNQSRFGIGFSIG